MRKMKKALATVLAATMVMGMSSTAWAEKGTTDTTETTETTFTIKKAYVKSNGASLPEGIFPKETLKFNVTAKQGNPSGDPGITVTDHKIDNNPDDIIVTIGKYTTVGKYNYTVSEQEGNTQGVVYSDNTFDVQVLAYWNTAHDEILTNIEFTTGTPGEKVDTITNKYDIGQLTIDKNVTGNLASQTQAFDIDVVFTSDKPVLSDIAGVSEWTNNNGVYTSNTVTFSIAHNDTPSTIENIPAGVSYTVVEQSKHIAADDANGSDPSKGYSVSYKGERGTIKANETSAAVVTNNKGTTVDTGITLDSLPYIMILAVAALGMVGFVAKKRKEEEMF